MRQDRFLTGILIGIGILVVAALAMFFIRRDDQAYLSDDTPEGVVHNYVVSILNKDYEKAYGYLAEPHSGRFHERRGIKIYFAKGLARLRSFND